jgi:hypothetical protein
MSIKLYKINRGEAQPLYKTTYKTLQIWAKLNPGEMQSWELVDAIEELEKVQEELKEAQDKLENWRSAAEDRRFD